MPFGAFAHVLHIFCLSHSHSQSTSCISFIHCYSKSLSLFNIHDAYSEYFLRPRDNTPLQHLKRWFSLCGAGHIVFKNKNIKSPFRQPLATQHKIAHTGILECFNTSTITHTQNVWGISYMTSGTSNEMLQRRVLPVPATHPPIPGRDHLPYNF